MLVICCRLRGCMCNAKIVHTWWLCEKYMRGEGSTIHNVAYADDVVRVSIEKVVDGEAQVPFPTLEI